MAQDKMRSWEQWVIDLGPVWESPLPGESSIWSAIATLMVHNMGPRDAFSRARNNLWSSRVVQRPQESWGNLMHLLCGSLFVILDEPNLINNINCFKEKLWIRNMLPTESQKAKRCWVCFKVGGTEKVNSSLTISKMEWSSPWQTIIRTLHYVWASGQFPFVSFSVVICMS